MPRQNFISKDFFAKASEQETKKAILEIPGFAKAVSFVQENTLIQSWRFLYNCPNEKDQYIDVSLLPLNDGHTCITLHSSFTNGHSFYKDRYITAALTNFEAAIHAALKGTTEEYLPGKPKMSTVQKMSSSLMFTVSSIGMFIFWKKIY